MREWSPSFDMTTIPDDVWASEAGRRSNARRKVHSGGSVWAKHNPRVKWCHCEKCNARREKEQAGK